MKLNNLHISVILFTLSFIVFLPSLENDFVWDDVSLIEKSSTYFERLDFGRVFVPKDINKKKHKYYRPTLDISMYLDYRLWGINPFGFHLTNILIFSFCCVAFYFLSLLLLNGFSVDDPRKYAFISSIVFILHPMHVESVSWIAGRTDLLCGFFFVLAFIFHMLSWDRLLFLLPAAVFFYLSLLSKEVALGFPLVVIFFDILSGMYNRKNLLKYLIYISASVIYMYLRSRSYVSIPQLDKTVMSEASSVTGASGVNYFSLLQTFFNSYLFYAYKLVLPFEFNAYIAEVPKGFYYFISSVLFLSAILLISVVSYVSRKALIAFSTMWVLVTLGPSVLVAVFSIASTPLAERYLFIPSMGFCILAGYVFSVFQQDIQRYKTIAVSLLIGLMIVYIPLNIERQKIWKSRTALWEDTSRKSADTAFTHSNYGKALHDEGQYSEAVEQYMIALDPEVHDSKRGRAVTANNLSLVYIELGEYGKAEYWLIRAREYDQYYLKTYYHLGLVNYIKGEISNSGEAYNEAEEHLKKVLDVSPGYGRARLLLAKVYLSRGELDKARAEAEKARKRLKNRQLLMEAEKIIEIDDNPGYQ